MALAALMRRIALHINTTPSIATAPEARIFEIACVGLDQDQLTGNNSHQYLQPCKMLTQQEIDTFDVTNEFLADKPRFANVVEELMSYLKGSELLVECAGVVEQVNTELRRIDHYPGLAAHCEITDISGMVQRKYCNQQNDLASICKQVGIDRGHFIQNRVGAQVEVAIIASAYQIMMQNPDPILPNQERISSFSKFCDHYPGYPELRFLGKIIEVERYGPYCQGTDCTDSSKLVIQLDGRIEAQSTTGNYFVSFSMTGSVIETEYEHRALMEAMNLGEAVLV